MKIAVQSLDPTRSGFVNDVFVSAPLHQYNLSETKDLCLLIVRMYLILVYTQAVLSDEKQWPSGIVGFPAVCKGSLLQDKL